MLARSHQRARQGGGILGRHDGFADQYRIRPAGGIVEEVAGVPCLYAYSKDELGLD